MPQGRTIGLVGPDAQEVGEGLDFAPPGLSKHFAKQAVSDALAETFLQDCDPEIQATYRTARQSLAVLEQPVQSAAWQQVASTYLVCAQDRGTPAELQHEFACRQATSWSSTPATTRSCPSRPPSATWC